MGVQLVTDSPLSTTRPVVRPLSKSERLAGAAMNACYTPNVSKSVSRALSLFGYLACSVSSTLCSSPASAPSVEANGPLFLFAPPDDDANSYTLSIAYCQSCSIRSHSVMKHPDPSPVLLLSSPDVIGDLKENYPVFFRSRAYSPR